MRKCQNTFGWHTAWRLHPESPTPHPTNLPTVGCLLWTRKLRPLDPPSFLPTSLTSQGFQILQPPGSLDWLIPKAASTLGYGSEKLPGLRVCTWGLWPWGILHGRVNPESWILSGSPSSKEVHKGGLLHLSLLLTNERQHFLMRKYFIGKFWPAV